MKTKLILIFAVLLMAVVGHAKEDTSSMLDEAVQVSDVELVKVQQANKGGTK